MLPVLYWQGEIEIPGSIGHGAAYIHNDIDTLPSVVIIGRELDYEKYLVVGGCYLNIGKAPTFLVKDVHILNSNYDIEAFEIESIPEFPSDKKIKKLH